MVRRFPSAHLLGQLLVTRPTLATSFCVQSAATSASDIHGPGKPGCDDGTNPEYPNQHNQVQKQVFQLFVAAFRLAEYA